MNQKLDKKYHELALTALHQGLINQDMPENSIYTKAELLKAFEYSGNILRQNHSNEQVRIMANSVFETSIKLARYMFFPAEARLIILQEKEYTLEEESQVDTLKRNLKELKKIIEG